MIVQIGQNHKTSDIDGNYTVDIFDFTVYFYLQKYNDKDLILISFIKVIRLKSSPGSQAFRCSLRVTLTMYKPLFRPIRNRFLVNPRLKHSICCLSHRFKWSILKGKSAC